MPVPGKDGETPMSGVYVEVLLGGSTLQLSSHICLPEIQTPPPIRYYNVLP